MPTISPLSTRVPANARTKPSVRPMPTTVSPWRKTILRMSYAATQRTQEIGIRVAMGASPQDILKMVLRQGLTVVGIGLTLGLVVALGGTRVLSGHIVC